MSDDDSQDPREPPVSPLAGLSDDDLIFLRDEGLDILRAYRSIRDRRKRELIIELITALVEEQPKTDGR